MRLLCTTGLPGCGKEEFLRVAEEKGWEVVRMGDVVREEAKRRGLPDTDESIGGFASEERLKHHYGVWADRTLPKLTTTAAVVDGVRSPEEVEVFRREAEVVVVAIHAPPAVRHVRIQQRARRDDAVTEEDLHRRDHRELKWGLGNVIALADHVLLNDGDLTTFRRRCADLLKALVA